MNPTPQDVQFDPSQLSEFPTLPGVYIMRDGGGEAIYIGKAANLRSRVRQYFAESGDGRPFIEYLRRHVVRVEFVLTASEKEAFLLENTLIKRHQPRYNIRLRDDKTYVSLRFAMGHPYPRLEVVRVRGRERLRSRFDSTDVQSASTNRRSGKSESAADLYFGPYDSAHSVRETIRFLLRVFPVRTCKDSVFNNRTRPCLLYDIGKCCGPCTEPVDRGEYRQLVEGAAAFLQGQNEDVRDLLLRRMEQLAEGMEFEKAALVRDRLQAIDRTLETQAMASHDGTDRDLVAIASERGRSLILLHEVRQGTLVHVREHYLKNHELVDGEVLYAFLQQHYSGLGMMTPREILVSTEPAEMDLLMEALKTPRRALDIRQPQRGELADRIRQLATNARMALQRNLAGEQTQEETTEELQKRLHLSRPPRTIECVDISNIMGALAVGALVRFEDGQPDKSGWRLYKIRSVEGANDFAMMQEVLSRRFAPGATNARPLPDLLLVDGGKGQLAVAVAVLKELDLLGKLEVGGIAKARVKVRSPSGKMTARKASSGVQSAAAFQSSSIDDGRLRTEERIFLPNRSNPVTFPINSPALHYLVRIRDETHRSAITFHRSLRAKANRRSMLDEIPGVGPKRKKALLRAFGSLAALRSASLEELAAVVGVGMAAAQAVHQFLATPAGKLVTDASRYGERPADIWEPTENDQLTDEPNSEEGEWGEEDFEGETLAEFGGPEEEDKEENGAVDRT